MSVWTLLCARHNTVAENSASSDLPLCTSQQTATRRDDLGDLERTLQGLIDDFRAALTGQRRRDDFFRRLKKKRDNEGLRAAASHPGPRVNVEGELGLLRRLMRTLRRWRSGSEAVTERGVDEMRDYVVRTRERLLLHWLERTLKERDDASWILNEWPLDGDRRETEGGLAEEVGKLERAMEALNVRISSLTRRGMEMKRILETEGDIGRLHRKAEQLRDKVVAMVMGSTDSSSNSSGDISPPPETDPSSLSGTLIDPNNTQYHPLINHLFRLAGINRRLVEALRQGGHRSETDQNGNDTRGTQTGCGSKHTGNVEQRAKSRRLKTGCVEVQCGSGEKETGNKENKIENREMKPGNGENKTGDGETKTGSVLKRPVRCGVSVGKCGPQVDALEREERVGKGGLRPEAGVRSPVRWMTSSGERYRCSMSDAGMLLDQLRRMKRWLGQRELFSSAELRDIERRTESHLRSDVSLDSHSLLYESHFFIEDLDSIERTRTFASPFIAPYDDSSSIDERGAIPAPTADPPKTKPTVTKSVSYTDSVNIANERLI